MVTGARRELGERKSTTEVPRELSGSFQAEHLDGAAPGVRGRASGSREQADGESGWREADGEKRIARAHGMREQADGERKRMERGSGWGPGERLLTWRALPGGK